MKFFKEIKWKILIITALICLLPILAGIFLWDKLPDVMAIHFNINNEPDNFASKEFVVLAIPFIMALLQIICCAVNDITAAKRGNGKICSAPKWITPIVAVVLQSSLYMYSMDKMTDIRKVAAVLVGVILIITGVCVTKLDYIKNYKISKEKARKINKLAGISSAVMGVLFIISIFFPPVVTAGCVLLLIPYGTIVAVYSIIIMKKRCEN